MTRECIVYSRETGGHRADYLDVLASELRLVVCSGPLSLRAFGRMFRARALLFATIDDDLALFAALGILRAIVGRPTAGLFIRPQTCFSSTSMRFLFKRIIYTTLAHIPTLTTATIIPFDIAPNLSAVARIGVADPQLWDVAHPIVRATTPLSKEIQSRLNGRKLCINLGTQSPDKGLPFLSRTVAENENILGSTLIVCAGLPMPSAHPYLDSLERSGAIVIRRHLTHTEILSLYQIADLVWACYEPSRDQASGVFGRAIQFGIGSIVRKNSVVHLIAQKACAPFVAIDIADQEALTAAFLAVTDFRTDDDRRQFQISAWRAEFRQRLTEALKLPNDNQTRVGSLREFGI